MKLIPMNALDEKGIPYSRAHLYRLIHTKKFPAPIRLGENRIAFVEEEIDAWLEQKRVERDTQEAPNAA
jgi:prophage regulatory protein